jgi:hypothetical protein
MSTFNGAKDQYYGFVEATVNRVKALLDPSPYVQWASGKVEYYVDPDKLVDTSVEYAGKVASFGPGEQGAHEFGNAHRNGRLGSCWCLYSITVFLIAVPKVVEIADPLIKTSVKTYGSVHDTVVVSFPFWVAFFSATTATGVLAASAPPSACMQGTLKHDCCLHCWQQQLPSDVHAYCVCKHNAHASFACAVFFVSSMLAQHCLPSLW